MFRSPTMGRRSILCALIVCLATASSSYAIRFLQPGPQRLSGVIVDDGGQFGLLLSAGSRSEQFIQLEPPMGNKAMFRFLKETSVPRRQYPDIYEGIARHELEGNLAGRMGSWRFYVAKVPGAPGPDGPDPELIDSVLRMWRSSALELESPRDARDAARAIQTLERLGLAEQMIGDVLQLSAPQ